MWRFLITKTKKNKFLNQSTTSQKTVNFEKYFCLLTGGFYEK